jgi:membrane-associated phospholipid phosphatase
MEPILDWGMSVVRSFQSVQSPALTALMEAISFLGSEIAFLALLPLVFWCVDERRGFRLGFMMMLSAWINGSLKDLWRQPRPYDIDPAVALLRDPTEFGLPSGHSQSSVTFWGIVGSYLSAPAGIIVALALPLAVGVSRVYLGAHFPTDVFAGWALGAALVVPYLLFGEKLASALAAADLRVRILAAAGAAFAMNALHPQDVSLGGVVFGMGVGYALMVERFPFAAAKDADGGRPSYPRLALRYLVGMAGTAAIYFGLKLALPGEGTEWYALGRFARYALLGAWVSAGAPWIFLKLKLAGGR